jgi:hypothetical protein
MIGTGESRKPACTLLAVAGHADTQAVISEHARANGHSVIPASTPALGLSTVGMSQPGPAASFTGDVSCISLSRLAFPASREMLHAQNERMLRFGI